MEIANGRSRPGQSTKTKTEPNHPNSWRRQTGRHDRPDISVNFLRLRFPSMSPSLPSGLETGRHGGHHYEGWVVAGGAIMEAMVLVALTTAVTSVLTPELFFPPGLFWTVMVSEFWVWTLASFWYFSAMGIAMARTMMMTTMIAVIIRQIFFCKITPGLIKV